MSFLAKLALAKVKLRGVDKAGRTDEKLGEIIRNFSYDEKEVATKRRQASRSFHNTLRLINRVDGRQISLSDEKLELKQYLSLVKKQIMDIVKVVSLIKSLVEDEDLQLLYDVRAALSVLEDFVNALKKNVRGLKVPRETKNKLESIAKEIDHSFEKLLTDVQAMVSKIYQYLRSTGFKTEASPTQEIDLGTFVRDRTRLKRQVNGKVQYIRFKIKELITQLNEIKKSSEDKDKISSLVTVLAYFNKQFTGLVEFSLSRGEMSTQVVLSSITMQKKYLKELDELKVELEKFEELIGQTKNEKQKAKLKNDYVLLQGEIDDIQDELKDIADTEKEEKKYIRLEARYGRRVKRGIGKIARGIAAGVALTIIGSMATCHIAKQESMGQNFEQGYHQQMEEHRLEEQDKQTEQTRKEFAKAGVKLPRLKDSKIRDGSSGKDFSFKKSSGNEYVFEFYNKNVSVDLNDYNQIIHFNEKTSGRTSVQRIPITIKESFKLISLSADAKVRFVLGKGRHKKDLKIYCQGDVVIVDGPNNLRCSSSVKYLGVTSNKEENWDYAGWGLKKSVYRLGKDGKVTDLVILVDSNRLPDSFIQPKLVGKYLSGKITSEELLLNFLEAQKDRAVYWGAPGVSDWDKINPVCNGLMRNVFYGIFGDDFFRDVKRAGIKRFRSNIYWNQYFKKKGVYHNVGKKTTLLHLNNYLEKKNIKAKPGMILQLEHDGGRHSVVVGKVTEDGKIRTIYTGYISALKKLKGYTNPTYDTGVGEILETTIPADLSHKNYNVEGLVFTDKLVDKLARKHKRKYLAN